MTEIDVEVEVKKYEVEMNGLIAQLNQLDQQRAEHIRAIQERRGILIFLQNLNSKEKLAEGKKPI